MHESHVDFLKPMFLIGDMHNYKSRIDFTLFWVLKTQYYASTGVAPGGQIQPSGDSYKTSGVLKHVAPGGKGCLDRRHLQKQ